MLQQADELVILKAQLLQNPEERQEGLLALLIRATCLQLGGQSGTCRMVQSSTPTPLATFMTICQVSALPYFLLLHGCLQAKVKSAL